MKTFLSLFLLLFALPLAAADKDILLPVENSAGRPVTRRVPSVAGNYIVFDGSGLVASLTPGPFATGTDAANLTGTLAAARIADGSLAIAKTSGLQAALDAKATDAAVVKLSGNQTIAGVKSFADEVNLASVTTSGAVNFGTGTTYTADAGAVTSFKSAFSVPTGTGTTSGTNTGDQTAASLGLVIGTNVQAWDTDLTTWAGITPSASIQTALPNATNGAGGLVSVAGLAGGTLPGSFTNTTIGSNSGSTSSLALIIGGDTNTGAMSDSADNFCIVTGGTVRIRLNSNGASFGNFSESGSLFGNANSNRAVLSSSPTTSTAPGVTYRGDTDTGAGWDGSNNFYGIAGGATITTTSPTGFAVTGYIATTPVSRSGPGAVSVAASTTELITTGVADALTLANGVAGQQLTIKHVTDGGSAVLTPTTKTGWSTATFTAAGETLTLEYSATGGWYVMAAYGATVAP